MINIKHRLPIVALMATLIAYPFEDAIDASAFGSDSPWLERATQAATPMITKTASVAAPAVMRTAVATADKPVLSGNSSLPMTAAIGTACAALVGGGLYCAYRWYYNHHYFTVHHIIKDLKTHLKNEYPDHNQTIYWNEKVGLNDEVVSLRRHSLSADKYGIKIRVGYYNDAWYILEAEMIEATSQQQAYDEINSVDSSPLSASEHGGLEAALDNSHERRQLKRF